MPQDSLEPILIPSHRRRRVRRRRRNLRWVLPLILRSSLAVVLLLVTVSLLSRAIYPYSLRSRQKQETLRLEQALKAAQAERLALQRELKLLKSGEGLEREARKLGYIRPGEIPLHITIEAPPSPAPPP